MNDAQLLADIPEYLAIQSMFKAVPAEEAGKRFIYFEASNEKLDQQGEKVLAKALEDSADIYLKHGNVDLDHYSLIGKPNPAKGFPGLPNYTSYEIGKPVAVRIENRQTFVKAELYSGATELAANANMVWESMTALNPPARWYPSVGGAVMAKSMQFDPETQTRVAVIEKVRWTNVALSRTPVNQNLPTAGTVPFGALAKCWTANGLMLSKALEAGYGTDSATLTGGSALRVQSVGGAPPIASYFDFRHRMGARLSKANVGGKDWGSANEIIAYSAKKFGLSLDEASEWTERFLRDLKTERNKGRSKP
jgi:hypothetical protein